MRLFITGGNGLLGKELQKIWKDEHEIIAPSSKEVDITDGKAIYNAIQETNPNFIIHLAAYTDVKKAEEEKELCYKVNVEGTRNIVRAAWVREGRVIYLSTDYVFDGKLGNYSEADTPNPVNYYAWTKFLGELEVRRLKYTHLVIRTSFGPKEWPHEFACTDMFTSKDTIDVIAPKIAQAVFLGETDTIHVGTQVKSVYDYARALKPDVKPITREELKVELPYDVSLNTSLFDSMI